MSSTELKQPTENAESSKGTLYLIPNLLGGDNIGMLPEFTKTTTLGLDHFIVETLRDSRRFLIKLGIKKIGRTIDELNFIELDKHAKNKNIDWKELLAPALAGQNMGLLSDAGCPGVADPGAKIAAKAHNMGITVCPLIGPSSILLALMGSGLNGQSFAFNGYLPIQKADRMKRLEHLEKWSMKTRQTQIFMEAPFRNNSLLEDVLRYCRAETKLCIATDLTLDTQFLKTKRIEEWRKDVPDLHKRPTIFIIGF